MHPIVLLIIAGAGGYLLWDSMEENPPDQQSLPTPDGNRINVPVTGDKPVTSTSNVPIPPGQGEQAIHKPHHHHHRQEDRTDPVTPTITTPTGTANLSVQTVQDLQQAINTIGAAMPRLRPNGTVDARTKNAIGRLQRQFGMPATGIPDMPTIHAVEIALGNLGKSAQPLGAHPAIQYATHDTAKNVVAAATQLAVDNVEGLQKALNAIGTKPALIVDGKIGSKTTAAIKAFQISQGLVADGIIGPKTVTALQGSVDPGTMAVILANTYHAKFTGEFGGHGRKKKRAA
jgi:peptidoglycan hydrolase-like protein with peptidoglycan-binding domain